MKEKKNIDRLFQEKFKDFEMHPSDGMWERIASAKAKKEDRKIIPLWLRLGGIAAALAILLSLGFALWNTNDESTPEMVQTNTEDAQKTSEEKEDKGSGTQLLKSNMPAPSEQLATVPKEVEPNKLNTGLNNKNTPQNKANRSLNIPLNNRPALAQTSQNPQENVSNEAISVRPSNFETTIEEETTSVAASEQNNSSSSEQKETSFPTNAIQNAQVDEAIAQTQATKEIIESQEGKDLVAEAERIEAALEEEAVAMNEEEGSSQKWDVGAVAAPVYYGDFGGSGIDPQFKDNAKTGDVNLSYGVQISYAVSDKFKIRTGVSNVDLSYGTQDISFAPDIAARELSGVNYNQNARFLNVTDRISPQEFAQDAVADVQGGANSVSNGSLEQRVGYIEVPLEAVYVLSDKRLGLQLVGGVSTLLLNDNEIAIESNGLRTPIGESNSLNDLSFTTNIGVGVNYKVTDQIKIQMEPTLKYQLNAFEGSAGDFKPYYIGLYTGVSYRF